MHRNPSRHGSKAALLGVCFGTTPGFPDSTARLFVVTRPISVAHRQAAVECSARPARSALYQAEKLETIQRVPGISPSRERTYPDAGIEIAVST